MEFLINHKIIKTRTKKKQLLWIILLTAIPAAAPTNMGNTTGGANTVAAATFVPKVTAVKILIENYKENVVIINFKSYKYE